MVTGITPAVSKVTGLVRAAISQPTGMLGLGSRVLTVVASDDFTDTDGVLLTAHTPSGGGSWTRSAVASNNTVAPTIAAGRIYGENAATVSIYYHSYVPPTADYDVSCDVVMRSDNNVSTAGVAGRIVPGINTMYYAIYSTASNQWTLGGAVAGVAAFTSLTSGATLTVDQAYRVTLSLRGTQLTLSVNGVPLLSQVDAQITAKGSAGMRITNLTTSTTGLHLDNWSVGI